MSHSSRRRRSWIGALALALSLTAMEGAAAQSVLWAWESSGGDRRQGFSVDSAGDWNRDGVLDVMVGAPGEQAPMRTGFVQIFSGADGSRIVGMTTLLSQIRFAHAIAGIGDADGDGYINAAIGAPDMDRGGGRAGGVFVSSGVLTVLGSRGDQLGTSLSRHGDVDGDGYDEFLAGAPQNAFPGHEGTGYVTVVSSRKQTELFRVPGIDIGEAFGHDVESIGDLNSDGVRDFVVGAPSNDSGGQDAGAADIRSGVDGALLNRVLGTQAGARMGTAVAGPGDMDGDGFDEYVIASPGYDGHSVDEGLVEIWSGRTRQRIAQFRGETRGRGFGLSVAGALDYNNDGTPDLLIGSRGLNARNDNGAVTIVSGANLKILTTIVGRHPGDRFGMALAPVGDINGDGFDDFLAGAPGVERNGMHAGAAMLFGGE